MTTADEARVARLPFIVDHVVIVCKGCAGERTVWFDTPLTSAEQLITFMTTKLTACPCDARLCDVKAYIKGADEDPPK